MQIPILIGLLLPLLLSPLATKQIYEAAFRWEKRQIALDNAAIILGRRDRATLNYLVSTNGLLKALEIVHHPLHLCARIPATAQACIDKDLNLEAQIATLHATAHRVAGGMWRAGILEATAVMTRAAESFSDVKRSRDVPIRAHRCPVCLLETAWEIDRNSGTSTYLEAASQVPMAITVSMEGESLRQGKRWDYLLTPREDSP